MGKAKAKQVQELSKTEAAKALASMLAMLLELQRLEPELTLDGLKALLLVALAAEDEHQLRLPSIQKVSAELEKSMPSASRLVTGLSDPDRPALVQRRLGVSGSRSEALLLTDRGRELVAALLQAATGKTLEVFETQTYERLIEARKQRDGEIIKLKMVSVSKDALSMVVTPPEDFMSEEVQGWCEDFLSQLPRAEPAPQGMGITFSSVPDAVHFRIRWT